VDPALWAWSAIGRPDGKIIMNKLPLGSNDTKWRLWSGIFVAAFLAFMGYLNYAIPYSSSPVTNPEIWQLTVWGLLYLPIIVLPMVAQKRVSDFGFTLSPLLALAFIIVAGLCAMFNMASRLSWVSAVTEAFARTGEEVFFRGFLFDIFIQLFSNKRRAWLWAAIASSILFALVHTQTFQPSFLSQYGSPSTPAVTIIIERLLNVFGLAFVFMLLRVWTRSILPGAIAHSIANGGLLTVPFVLIIYFSILLRAYKRGEQITFGFQAGES
jgi:membrane protease YdiL (CAAX protease family)